MSESLNQQRTWDSSWVYLVYLAFLFLPWLFFPPATVDVVVAFVATLIFIPLYFASSKATGKRHLWLIASIALLGVVIAPFVNGYSVFHIYAVASAAYVRPVRTSGIVLAVCIIAYLASGYFFERTYLEMIVGLVISIVVWASASYDAQMSATHEQAERERALESQQASLVERERIARDLHDFLGHTLTLVALKADLAGRLIDSDHESAKAEIDSIQRASRKALGDVRATLSGLTSTSLKVELANGEAALEAAGVELFVTGRYPGLSAEQDTAIGLMIREAVTNVVRHSSAKRFTIDFEHSTGSLGVTITDNGRSASVTEGSGLSGLRKRLEALDGLFSVVVADGVQLRATLPL